MPEWSASIRERLAALSLEPTRETAVVEEIAQHLDDRYEELLAQGAEPEAARRAVLSELEGEGWLARLRSALPPPPPPAEFGRDEGQGALTGLMKDLRHGFRLLRLDPGFAAVAILSLALGIGANTAIFQLLDAVRLRTVPVEEPHQLANVLIVDNPHGRTGGFGGRFPQLTYALWERLREGQQAFSRVAAWSSEQLNLTRGGEARYAEALWVSGSFFDTVGVRPLRGRLLSLADDRPGCASPGVVVSERFWRRELGERGSVVGEQISLEGHPFEIVGVTPARFFGLEVGRAFDVVLPLCADALIREKPRTASLDDWWLAAVGRVKADWSLDRANAHLKTISPSIFAATLPTNYDATDAKHYLGFQLGARSVATGFSALRTDYADPLWLLLGISGLVLLIACANLANLMVARASARQREIAVRLALGASRRRLVRQLLAESLALAAVGAALGLAIAQALSRLLLSFLTTQDARWFVDLRMDWRLLAFAAALTTVTCILFGLLPAIQASRTQPIEAIKAGARGIAGGKSRLGVRRALVVSQVSLSLVLLVGALLFVRTLRNLLSLDAGFRRDHILVVEADFTPLKLSGVQRTEFKRQLVDRVRVIPGVTAVAGMFIIPASGAGWNNNISVEGTDVARQLANFNRIGPGFFTTMGTPLRAGRDFDERDRLGSEPVAIVTETFARKFLAGASPLGLTVRIDNQGGDSVERFQIVGMVKDTKYGDLREEFTPIVYVAQAQDEDPSPNARLVIRSDLPLAPLLASVKQAMAEVSPVIVLNFRPFENILREGLIRERLMATLSGFFGFLAALLAMIGLYGVISYMVVRRRNEIGVRMVLGATRGNVVAMILREAAALLGVGIAIGAVLAVIAATSARALLFGLRPSDPATLLIAAASLAAVAAAASFLPARRAATLDPMAALREE